MTINIPKIRSIIIVALEYIINNDDITFEFSLVAFLYYA